MLLSVALLTLVAMFLVSEKRKQERALQEQAQIQTEQIQRAQNQNVQLVVDQQRQFEQNIQSVNAINARSNEAINRSIQKANEERANQRVLAGQRP